jgi:hypothetical protein
MIPTAKDAALTSAINNWEVYYEHAFTQYLNGKGTIETDWCKGYTDGAVGISTLNTSCASGHSGRGRYRGRRDQSRHAPRLRYLELHRGRQDSHQRDDRPLEIRLQHRAAPNSSTQGDTEGSHQDRRGVSYFSESTLRSAPYFNVGVDASFTPSSTLTAFRTLS